MTSVELEDCIQAEQYSDGNRASYMKSDGQFNPVIHEQTWESLAMLKLLAQSQRSIEAGKHKPLEKAFADLTARTKKLP